jgi:hypothetical protein
MKFLSLEFITVTTGGTAMSPRSGVKDSVVTKIKQVVGKGGPLWGGWSIDRKDAAPGTAIFVMLHQGRPMSRNMVVWTRQASDQAWEEVEAQAPDGVVLHRPRGVPWLAADLLPGSLQVAMSAPNVLMELADAERCVAWAILENEA